MYKLNNVRAMKASDGRWYVYIQFLKGRYFKDTIIECKKKEEAEELAKSVKFLEVAYKGVL